MTHRLAIAFAFLTRLPIRTGTLSDEDVGRSAAFFPAVGLVLGLILGGTAALLGGVLTADVLAVLLAASLALLTGGLHLDGVADCFDALGAQGADRERRLEILRDSRIGAYGAAALVFVVLAKVVALHALLADRNVAAVIAFPMVARWAAVLVIVLFPYARRDGVGAAFHAHAGSREALAASALMPVALLLCGRAEWLATVVAATVALAFARLAARRFGGVTGDVCGAAIELAEVAFMVVAAAAS